MHVIFSELPYSNFDIISKELLGIKVDNIFAFDRLNRGI